MKQSLFEAYFGKALDVFNQHVLLECVKTVGLDPTAARHVLESDQFAAAVREDEATYQKDGASSVPAFIINQKYFISGTQEPEVLVKAFQDINAEAAS